MIRGTTPTISLKCELDWDNIVYLVVSFQQRGVNVFEILKTKCNYKDGYLTTRLEQEDSLKLIPMEKVKIQIKFKMNDSNVLATKSKYLYVDEILNEEVI